MARTSTIKGKQNVAYRIITDEGLETLIALPSSTSKLLYLLIKDADKHDNCCQISPSKLTEKYSLNKSNTYQHIRKLKASNYVKEVTDIHDATRLMINPIYISWQKRELVRFTILMYKLGSHSKAIEHRKLEQSLRAKINPDTGESHDWFKAGIERAERHKNIPQEEDYYYETEDHCYDGNSIPVDDEYEEFHYRRIAKSSLQKLRLTA